MAAFIDIDLTDDYAQGDAIVETKTSKKNLWSKVKSALDGNDDGKVNAEDWKRWWKGPNSAPKPSSAPAVPTWAVGLGAAAVGVGLAVALTRKR